MPCHAGAPILVVVVNLLLSITFACGLVIAAMHVANRRFLAPVYDVVLNLVAFLAAVASSVLMRHWLPAVLSGLAVGAWLHLALRTARAHRDGLPVTGQQPQEH